MGDQTRLKGITDIGQALLSNNLETNLVSWFQWGFLGIGAFFNVTIPSSGAYGGDFHRLRLVKDPYSEDGQVWQGFRQDWVWETGVEYAAYQPIRVSGVYVNGNFHSVAETGAYAHHVNYPLGQVVFETPISANSTVTCEYSHRLAHFTTSDIPWWRQLQLDSFRVDNLQFAQAGSGAWSLLAQNRIQLPAVVVEAIPNTSRKGLALGGGAIVRQDVLFNIISETPWDRQQLHDIITYQWQKRLVLFEKNWVNAADKFPLDENGSPASGALMYPDLIKATGDGGFGWVQLRFEDFRGTAQPHEVTAPLYAATVRAVCEVDLP